MSVCLVTVVSGDAYVRYAEELGESADEFFHPDPDTGFLILEGREGWPAATLYRYHVLLENEKHLRDFDHVFLVDADMRFEAPVGHEIVRPRVATQHPGYVGIEPDLLPYERFTGSAAWVGKGAGSRYYCGGFVGGSSWHFWVMARKIVEWIDQDNPEYAVWHDESYLNRFLIDHPPFQILPPSYCYPDNDQPYVNLWPERYERILVALDKSAAERGDR